MRDILFRGKTILGNFFVTGSYYKSCDLYGNECNEILLQLGNKYIVAPETVGQFTGLTDKNGAKIFEGDICRGAWGTTFEVFWDIGHTAFKARIRHELPYGQDIYYYTNFDDNKISAEVIGNIYDNPELLEVAEND